jgi:DNA-binding response OmpR family regulator
MAKILIVDDHPHILRLLQCELAAEADTVTTAATGEAALRKVREEGPDLVLLDVMLPGKDGFQVLYELKADPATRGIPVILLTAKALPMEVTHGLELGADWYATKPFRLGEIASLVRRFLAAAPPAGRDSASPLPLGEIDRLTLDAADAFRMAADGAVAGGYGRLSAGLQRASAARAARLPWAEELADCYEELRDRYVDRYGNECGAVAQK